MKNAALILCTVVMAGIIVSKEGASEEKKGGLVLYEQRGCGACHDRTRDQTTYRLGPSLEQIAEAYKGREDDLEKFLKGGCEPVVDETGYEVMHGEIVKLKGLSDSQIKDLREYICGEQ